MTRATREQTDIATIALRAEERTRQCSQAAAQVVGVAVALMTPLAGLLVRMVALLAGLDPAAAVAWLSTYGLRAGLSMLPLAGALGLAAIKYADRASHLSARIGWDG